MAKVIEGLYYSESHEYVRVEGDFGFIGITDYAQNALGNVVCIYQVPSWQRSARLWLRILLCLPQDGW